MGTSKSKCNYKSKDVVENTKYPKPLETIQRPYWQPDLRCKMNKVPDISYNKHKSLIQCLTMFIPDIVDICMSYTLQIENWNVILSTRTSTRGFSHIINPCSVIYPIGHNGAAYMEFYYDKKFASIGTKCNEDEIITFENVNVVIPRVDRPFDWYDKLDFNCEVGMKCIFYVNGITYTGYFKISPVTFKIFTVTYEDLPPDALDTPGVFRSKMRTNIVGQVYCTVNDNHYDVINKIELNLGACLKHEEPIVFYI